jgi:hypothetical protein
LYPRVQSLRMSQWHQFLALKRLCEMSSVHREHRWANKESNNTE